MSSSIDGVWQALPPRKKTKRRDDAAGGSASASSSSSSCSSSSFSSSSSSAEQSAHPSSVQITANIAQRSEARSRHVQGTLEHKDGCAGEFYEYLDHTADVQCHSWGATLRDALANMAPCMFNYMTDLSMVEEDASLSAVFTVTGHDLHTLLFAYMDEMLFRFSTDLFCICRVEVLQLAAREGEPFSLEVRAHGCKFDREKHVQGTEIKAITYSNMQVHEGADKCDIYVIVDI